MNSTVKQIARERVQVLFQQANRSYKANPQLAKSYIITARNIAMAARIRLPQPLSRSACKVCNAYLVPGETSRVRIRPRREPHMVVTCLACGNQIRIPLKIKHKVEKNQNEQDNKQDETSR
jgi:ribonuclease P protein subunit RPR2